MIIENKRIANNADIYIFTVENNASKLCVSSNANVAINIKTEGNAAISILNKNILDLFSFRNSIFIKVSIISPN